MPIFQADFEQREAQHGEDLSHPFKPASTPEPSSPPTTIHRHRRRLSEESIRTELCEGPVPDSPIPRTPEVNLDALSDRAELIERLKRDATPAWIADRHVNLEDDPPHSYQHLLAQSSLGSLLASPGPGDIQQVPSRGSKSPNLLPPAQITPEKTEGRAGEEEQRLREGLSIERPRSALHSGDFTHHSHDHDHDQPPQPRPPFPKEREAISSVHAHHTWAATSPPRPSGPLLYGGVHVPQTSKPDAFASIPSSLSSSFSSSFVYKPPTSPLVQSETNDDLEGPLRTRGGGIDISFSTPSAPRRPQSLYATASPTPFGFTPAGMSPQRTPSFRREATFPYQAHQPRRSLTSTPNNNNFYTSAPGTPAFLRSRRPSFSSDSSPLHHASMVGSYEESILRGRMSTTPSKPLDFLAQIGVLGMGKCKASLRCPPHVTLPFPAVFYSYNSAAISGTSGVEDGPSPYVGQIDLENGLGNPEEERRSRKKMQSRYADRKVLDGSIVGGGDDVGPSHVPEQDPPRRPPMPRKRSGSPKAPPGGSYRIPEKGRIQIVIKNQNKTAVKLFLVPYDLTGMEPGTKTFIRQRSYSAGPIIDGLPPPPKTAGKDGGNPDDERPVLRYLVHLHICCPSKGRFYLYRNVRVVFANRVPDGKARLRNETTWPEPRFSPYKPVRAMHPPVTAATRSGAMLAAEKAFRRRSAGFNLGGFTGASVFAHEEGLGTWQAWPHPGFSGHDAFSPATSTAALDFIANAGGRARGEPVDAASLVSRLPSRGRVDSGGSWSTNTTGAMDVQSPGPRSSSGEVGDGEDDERRRAAGASMYEKLSKGDVGYGGNAFAAGLGQGSPPEEGLLSQRLRSLGVRAGQFTEGAGFNGGDGHAQS